MLVAVLVLSAGTLYTMRSLVPAVLLGAWLAAVAEPLSVRVARRIGGRDRAATVLTLAMALAVVALASVVVLPVVSDVQAAVRAARKLVQGGASGAGLAQMAAGLSAAPAHESAGAGTPVLGLARELAPFAEAAVGVAVSAAMQVIVFVITAYYLVIDGRRLQAGLEGVSPFGPENTRAFVREFIAVGRGIALSAGLAGAATALSLGAGFLYVGAPRPFVLIALSFVASLLPIGAHIVWIPVAAWFLWHGRADAAAVLAADGLMVVGGLIDHGLRPWLVRFGRLELHPLLTALGLFGGVIAFGFWGVFLGPLLVAMTATAMRIYAQRPILARRSVIPGERVTVISSPPAAVPAAVEPATTVH